MTKGLGENFEHGFGVGDFAPVVVEYGGEGGESGGDDLGLLCGKSGENVFNDGRSDVELDQQEESFDRGGLGRWTGGNEALLDDGADSLATRAYAALAATKLDECAVRGDAIGLGGDVGIGDRTLP